MSFAGIDEVAAIVELGGRRARASRRIDFSIASTEKRSPSGRKHVQSASRLWTT